MSKWNLEGSWLGASKGKGVASQRRGGGIAEEGGGGVASQRRGGGIAGEEGWHRRGGGGIAGEGGIPGEGGIAGEGRHRRGTSQGKPKRLKFAFLVFFSGLF